MKIPVWSLGLLHTRRKYTRHLYQVTFECDMSFWHTCHIQKYKKFDILKAELFLHSINTRSNQIQWILNLTPETALSKTAPLKCVKLHSLWLWLWSHPILCYGSFTRKTCIIHSEMLRTLNDRLKLPINTQQSHVSMCWNHLFNKQKFFSYIIWHVIMASFWWAF